MIKDKKILFKSNFNFFIDYCISAITLFLALAFLITGTSLFWIGFHNIDLGYNIRVMNVKYEIDFIDVGNDEIERSGRELYSLGLDQIVESIAYIFSGGFLFGMLYLSMGIDLYKINKLKEKLKKVS